MTTNVKSQQGRTQNLIPAWHIIDAEGKTLGRLSSEIAVLLQGKHKPTYVSYINTGDYVVVINANKIRVTGKKLDQKVYYRHSGYPGGLKEQTLSDLLKKTPTNAIKYAVKGMLPKNTLRRRRLSRLKLYADESHPHAAQVNARRKPAVTEISSDRAAATGTKSGATDKVSVSAIIQNTKKTKRPRTSKASDVSKTRAKLTEKNDDPVPSTEKKKPRQ